jgi:hypothetical protein
MARFVDVVNTPLRGELNRLYVLRPIMCSAQRLSGRFFPAQLKIMVRATAHNRQPGQVPPVGLDS